MERSPSGGQSTSICFVQHDWQEGLAGAIRAYIFTVRNADNITPCLQNIKIMISCSSRPQSALHWRTTPILPNSAQNLRSRCDKHIYVDSCGGLGLSSCIVFFEIKKNRVEAPQGGMAGLVPPTTTGEAPEGDKYQVESDKYKNSREISG